MATHVHENMVARQLQIMFQIVRQWERSAQRFESNERVSRDGIGLALIDSEAPRTK